MSQETIELQLTALIESMHPQLVGKVLVKFDARQNYLLWVQKRGERTKLTLPNATMRHPQTLAILHRAAMYVLEIRRGTTQAVEIGGPSDTRASDNDLPFGEEELRAL